MAPQGKFTGSARVKFRFPAISSPPIYLVKNGSRRFSAQRRSGSAPTTIVTQKAIRATTSRTRAVFRKLSI